MHQHGHDEEEGNSSRNLAVVSLINFGGFLFELIGGIAFGSIALLSDAFHMLFDMLAYAIAFLAAYIAEDRHDENIDYTIHRIEPLAAFFNGVLLIPMVGYIIWESYQRFLSPVDIETIPVISIAVVGLVVNISSVYVLNDEEMSLNEKGAFYHLLGDAGGSIAVIVSTTVIHFGGPKMIDPTVAVLIGFLILLSSAKILKGSGSIFLHKSFIDVDSVRSEISSVDGVAEVGCVHDWRICSQINVATVHVKVRDSSCKETESINKSIHEILYRNGVDHATVELRTSFSDEDGHLHNHSH